MSAPTAPPPFNQKKRLLIVQLSSALALMVLLVSRSGWNEGSVFSELIEATGFGLILLCIFGRLWCILYIGSRKNSELVTAGPYSMSRNPLYLFSTIGAIGIGLTFGSFAVAMVLGCFSYLVFAVTAHQEAKFLRGQFGPRFASYAARTPLFWPNIWLYREPREMTFSPLVLKRTFFDALFFLGVYPAVEGVEHLQTIGYLPTLFWFF